MSTTRPTGLSDNSSAVEYWPEARSTVQFVPAQAIPDIPATAVTAYALQDGRILLTKNSRGWDTPGGHIEPGEEPEAALTREILEETGAIVHHLHYIGYLHITQLKKTPANQHYPPIGSILIYAGSHITFVPNYTLSHEATARQLAPMSTLPTLHHNWTPMKQQILNYANQAVRYITSG